MILFATILASGMAFLDGTVVNIALPAMQKSLDATLSGMQWVINSYALMLAALILVSGSLGDSFGRKKIFLYGIFTFMLFSFLCSISQTIEQLIFFRTLQGIGAAMMIPGSLSIISTSFVEHVRGKAIGLWSGLSGGVIVLGPFLGGWLVETFGWPSIFLLNLPLGIIALLLTLKFIPESKNHEAQRIDIAGTFAIFISLLGICFALIQAPELTWSNPLVFLSMSIGIAAFIAFFIVEKKVKEPILPYHIFKSPLVTGANIVTFFLYFALSGVLFFLILNLQQLQHYSPLAAGLSTIPTVLLITFLSGPAGGWSDKMGPRFQMIMGPLLVSIGMGLLILPGIQTNYFIDFLPGLFLFGLGMALVIAPLTKSALAVEHKYAGAASGVNNAVSRIAGLLAIALLGAIVIGIFSSQLHTSLSRSMLTTAQQNQILSQQNKLGGIEIPTAFTRQEQQQTKTAIDSSFLYSFRVAMSINAFLAFLSAVIALFLIHNPKEKKS